MATFTPADVIADARFLIQDQNVAYRISDADFLRCVNQALRRACTIRPDLFAYITTMNCVQGPIQTTPADCVRLMEVFQVVGGNNMNEVNRDALDLMFNSWQTTTPGVPSNWCRHQRNPRAFIVWVPAIAGTQLLIEYAQAPSNLTLNATVPLIADAYFPAIVDCTVALAESIDNESANNGRSKQFMDSFINLLGADATARQNIDNEDAGEPPNTSPS